MSEHRLLGRGDVERLLDERGLKPRKSLGQNFVVDPNMIERIVRTAGVGPHDRVLEIGAGLGSLTLALEAAGASVLAVEIDPNLVEVLRQQTGDRVSVVEADAMELNFEQELSRASGGDSGPWRLVANLPYNVASPLVMSVLQFAPSIDRLVVMVQREVAERFVAKPSTKQYGSVTVRISYFATARLVARVPREVFLPRPHVDSAIVEIIRRPSPAVDPVACGYEDLARVIRAGFSQRRKMLRRALAGTVTDEAFVRAGVDSTLRAENLDVGQWGKLTACQLEIDNSRTPS